MLADKNPFFTLCAFLGLPIKIRRPVVIYQMGKVASSSVYSALAALPNISAFHAHYLHPDNLRKLARHTQDFRGLSRLRPHYKRRHLYEQIFHNRKTPVEIITLVREPVARNISAFFQNLDRVAGAHHAHKTLPSHVLIERFLTNYSHDAALNWFDDEFRRTTNVDVYRSPFSTSDGFAVIEQWPYRILVLRSDLADKSKEMHIRSFLDIATFEIPAANVGYDKRYGETYKRFLDAIRIPEDYAKRMLYSKYARHFFSEEEREESLRKWTCDKDSA